MRVKAVVAVADAYNVDLNRRLEEAHTTVGRVTLMIPGRPALDDGPQQWSQKLLHQSCQSSNEPLLMYGAGSSKCSVERLLAGVGDLKGVPLPAYPYPLLM